MNSSLNVSKLIFEKTIKPAIKIYERKAQDKWVIFFDVTNHESVNMENFRKEHFEFVDYPLTYNVKTNRPVINGLASTFEYLNFIKDYANSKGGYVGVNTSPHPYSLAFLSSVADLSGDEHMPGQRESYFRLVMQGKKMTGCAVGDKSWEELLKNGVFYGFFLGKKPPYRNKAKVDYNRRQ